VKDRVRSRVNMMAAMIARVGRTAHDAMMFRLLLALITERHSVRMEITKEPIKASSVIGKHRVKVFLGKARHFGFAVHGLPTLRENYA
jgi:hypothetical protein